MKKDSFLYKLINQFEIYISAWIFIGMTVLLFVQVITRYFFHHAITWTEELSCMLFVWLVYLGVAAAVRARKHLRVDILINSMPFKIKRIFLLFSNIVSMICFGLLISPLYTLVQTYAMVHAKTDLLRFPKAVAYAVVPVCLILTIIRFVQDSIVLMRENEQELGASVPAIDIEALEAEAVRNGFVKNRKEETK